MSAQLRQHQRRGCIAGDDDEIGTLTVDQLAHEGNYTGDQLGLTAGAVRKKRIIGDVDEACIRTSPGDLAKDGQAAESGIEDENGRCNGWQGDFPRE